MLKASENDNKRWWGSFEIPHDRGGRWRVGPLNLWIQRLAGEWRIASELIGQAQDTLSECEVPVDCSDLLAFESVRRFGVGDRSEMVSIMPALADRPVVSTPEKPFYVPAGETVTVYLGSPVWAQIRVGETPKLLSEFPLHTPSDTWFGLNTQQGELCYASRTFCRLRRDELARRPHRCVTAVVIENHATTALYLEQMKLPVPYLTLFGTDEGSLWTEDVVLERIDEEELAPMRVRPGAPAGAPGARLISEPRLQASENLMVRAFGKLFS